MKHYDPYENSKMVILSFFIKFGICINLTIRNFPILWLWEEEKGRGKFMNILTIFIGSKFLEVNSLSQELGKFQPVWYIQIKVAGYKFLFFCCFLCFYLKIMGKVCTHQEKIYLGGQYYGVTHPNRY